MSSLQWTVHIGACCKAQHEWNHNIVQQESLVCIWFCSWVFLANFITFRILINKDMMMMHFDILIPNPHQYSVQVLEYIVPQAPTAP